MTLLMYVLGGAAAGAGVAVVLYLLGFGVELVNCACNILACNFNPDDAIPGMWSGEAFGRVLFFCAIGGAVIGMIYGLFKMKSEADALAEEQRAESSKEEKAQQQKWASELKKEAQEAVKVCDRNMNTERPLVSTAYQAGEEMKTILNELAKAAELQGLVDSIADELTQKGGAQG